MIKSELQNSEANVQVQVMSQRSQVEGDGQEGMGKGGILWREAEASSEACPQTCVKQPWGMMQCGFPVSISRRSI